MSLSNSLPQLKQAFRDLRDNFEKSVAVLRNAEPEMLLLGASAL